MIGHLVILTRTLQQLQWPQSVPSSLQAQVDLLFGVRTKPLARRTLRVRLARSSG